MEYLIFLLLVIIFIFLISNSQKSSKVSTKLNTTEQKIDVLYQMLKDLHESVDSLKKNGVHTVDKPITSEVEQAVTAPIPPAEVSPSPVESISIVPETIEQPVLESIDPIESTNTPPPLPTSKIQHTPEENYREQTVDYNTAPSYESKFMKKLKEVNWLNAIGIITLVLGIGFFVKYAIDQDWINEVGRVALGIAVGGIIVGLAHKLSSKYHVFSSILMGGGFATFYTTITLAFREYEIFNQTTAFILLIVITILAVLLSIAYKRQELAIFAFIGGMLSPLLVSTGAGDHIVLFSYILLLNIGVLFVAIRQKWLVVDKFSYVLTFLYLLSWIFSKYQVAHQLSANIFIALFYLQFMVLLVLRYIDSSKEKSDWQHLIYIVTTNFIALLCFAIIHNESSGTNYLGAIIIGMALVNAMFIIVTTRGGKPINKDFVYTLLAVTIGLVSLSIPVQLSKVYITVVWAIEMSVLLWIWTRTKANLFRAGAIILAVLTVLSYLMDIADFRVVYEIDTQTNKTVLLNSLPILINRYTITGIVVLLSLIFAYFTLNKNKIEEESTIGLKQLPLPTQIVLQRVYYVLTILISFLVGYLEISFQMSSRVEYSADGFTSGAMRSFALATYTIVYIATYLFLSKKKPTQSFYTLSFIFSILILFIFSVTVTSFRYAIFYNAVYIQASFFLHWITFATLLYIYYWLYKHLSIVTEQVTLWLNGVLFISLVVMFSIELDNMVVWINNLPETYYYTLSNVHSYGYPILWGLMAMLLMVLGINKQKTELRKLSLISFGVIILKFYLYDVWGMSQGGKIASFVVLGIILLVVSFLLERIKLLLKDKEANKDTSSTEE